MNSKCSLPISIPAKVVYIGNVDELEDDVVMVMLAFMMILSMYVPISG